MTRYLDDHPEVFMATPKEVDYFLHNYDRGEDWYRAHFAKSDRSQKAGEATPSYMVSARAITRIKSSIPSAFLTVILREPVSRAYSHYWMRRERQREPRSFNDVIRSELAGYTALDDREEVGYVGHSLYARHLRRILKSFPKEQLHIVVLEELSRDARFVYRGLCDALGIDSAYEPKGLGRPINSYVTFRSNSVRKLARRLPKPIGRGVDLLNTRRKVQYPAIDPALAAELADFFGPHNRELEAILGRPIKDWSRPQGSP